MILALTLSVAVPLAGQTHDSGQRSSRSTIGGQVLDERDQPLANVTVSLPSLQRTTVTNDSGHFWLPNLPATEFVLEVRRLGYQANVRRVDLTGGRDLTLTLRISRAAVTVAEVIVTGNAGASERRGAQDVAALNDAQLRASATGSIGGTLQRLPGVSNMSAGPAGGNPVLRGMSQNRIRIVRDGVPQESFEASPRWFPPGNLASLDRIEVIRGPASILYGSNALGGAINMIRGQLPATGSGGSRLYGVVESQYFSNNDERYGHAEIAGALGAVGIRAGGARRTAGAFRTPDVSPFAVSQLPGAPKFTGRIDYSNYTQSSEYAQLGIAQEWGHIRAIYDGWEGYNNFPNANGKPAGVHSRNDDVRLQGNIVGGTLVFKPSVVVQRVTIQRAATIAKTFEVAADSNLWDQDLVNRIVTSRLEVAHPTFAGLRGTVGVEYSAQQAETRLSQIQPSGSVNNAAAFAFEEHRIDQLTLSFGVRGDARRQRAASNALVDGLPVEQRAAALDRSFHVATAAVGGAYQLSEPLSLSVNVSTGFRAPSFLDLYTNENRPALGGWIEGDPSAGPERSTSIETGLHYTTSRVALGVVAYRNALTGFTYLAKSTRTHTLNGTSLPVFVTDQAPARTAGLELNGTAEVLPSIVLDGSYAKIASRNLSTGEQLPLMPADQLRASLRYAPRTFGAIELPYAQVGVKHAWDKSIAGPTEPFADGGSQGFGVASTVSYTLVDVGVGGRWDVGASAIELHVTVDNLFNVAYRDFLDTQKGFTLGAGRNIGLRLAVPLVFTR